MKNFFLNAQSVVLLQILKIYSFITFSKLHQLRTEYIRDIRSLKRSESNTEIQSMNMFKSDIFTIRKVRSEANIKCFEFFGQPTTTDLNLQSISQIFQESASKIYTVIQSMYSSFNSLIEFLLLGVKISFIFDNKIYRGKHCYFVNIHFARLT